MLKSLLKKELQQMWFQSFQRGGKSAKNGRKRKPGKGMIVLWIFLIVYLLAFFTFMVWKAGEQFLPLPGFGWLYYMLMGGAALLFGALGSVFTTYASLYLAKDNDLLLSMPIPLRNVILSRLLGVYLMGLFYSASISVPALAVGLIQCGFSLPRLVGGLIWVLLISLIVLGLSALLGWVVARISMKLKNRSFIIVLLSLFFVGLYYVVYFRIINHLPELIQSVMRYGEDIRGSWNPVYLFGRMGEGDWLAMLIWIAGVCLLLALIWLVLRRSFLAVATASAGGKKAIYREKTARQGSVSVALLRKEWYRFSSSAAYMLNCGLGLLFLLGLGGYLLIKGRELLVPLSTLPFLQADPGILPVLICTACCMMGFMVDITAPSVSLEGRTIWQLQSLPVTAWQVLRSKLQLHLGLSIVPTLFCVIVAVALVPATLAQKLLIAAIGLLFMLLMALLGLALGVKMPNLNWTNEVVPIKQGAPVAITIISGMALAAAIGGLYFLARKVMGPTAYLSVVALLLLAANAALFLWLRNAGARRFEELG
ncbi:MAG: hypothetical protein IKQ54_06110 [Oscillospiraceae bacterium]|nr:hypothetical protein [Oscillospiraceae bacterium]